MSSFVVPNRAPPHPPKCSSGRDSCQKHLYEWNDLATIRTEEIALLKTRKLDKKSAGFLGFFSHHENILERAYAVFRQKPQNSFQWFTLECLHTRFTLKKRKKENANSDFLTTSVIFHGTVELWLTNWILNLTLETYL